MVMFKALYEAYLRCRKHKRNTHNALAFEHDLIENLVDLETSLNDYSYAPSRSVCFLTTSPKLREVFAADFRDRVVHHLIVPVLEQIFEPKFIYDSYSNRKSRGTHRAVKRAHKFSRATQCYLQSYEGQKGTMSLEEIKKFLSVQASFLGHIKHTNNYNLQQHTGRLHETNPFDFDRN